MTTTKAKAVARQVALKLKGLPACGHECIQGEDVEGWRCCSPYPGGQWVCSLRKGHDGDHVACAFFIRDNPMQHAHTTWSNES